MHVFFFNFAFVSFDFWLLLLLFFSGNINKQSLNALPDTLQTNENDSFDLDLSISSVIKSKSKGKAKNDDDVGNGAQFVPSKGQKTAAKRLKKIGGTQNGLFVQFLF